MKTLHDWGLLVLRAGTSILLMTHGWSKFERLLEGLTSPDGVEWVDWLGIPPSVWLALTVLGEFIAPVFILIGFKTRWAAVPAAITMGAAAFVVHWEDSLGDKEHALLFFIPLLAIFLLGPGRWSFDKR